MTDPERPESAGQPYDRDQHDRNLEPRPDADAWAHLPEEEREHEDGNPPPQTG